MADRPRVHVARNRVERIESDDVAHLGAEFADLVDQADGADHPRQRDRRDAEKDVAVPLDLLSFARIAGTRLLTARLLAGQPTIAGGVHNR